MIALQRSPFFNDLIMTIHDFHFCIWKLGEKPKNKPIFHSQFTKDSHITCGSFSYSRPGIIKKDLIFIGVIFIGKNDGVIDIWDFIDQSHKVQNTIKMLTQFSHR